MRHLADRKRGNLRFPLCALLVAVALPGTPAGARSLADRGTRQQLTRIHQQFEGRPDYIGLPPRIDDSPLGGDARERCRRLRDFSFLAFLVQSGKCEEAARVFEKQGDRSQWPPALAILEVQTLIKQQQLDQARERCREIIKSRPETVAAYLLLADVLERAGGPDEAPGTVEENGKIAPRSPHHVREAPDEAGKVADEVVKVLEAARKMAPRNHRVLERLGRSYGARINTDLSGPEKKDLLDRLESVYEDLIAARPGQSAVPLLEVLAFIHEERGDPEKALPYMEKAVLLNPKATKSYLHLYELQRRTGRTSETLATLRRAFIATPDDRGLLAVINQALGGRENQEAFLDFYASAAKEYPGRDDIQLQYAAALSACSKPEEAAKVLRSLLDHHPRNQEAWLRLAHLQIAQSNLADARSAIEGYLTHAPAGREPLLFATRFFMQVGLWEDAESCLTRLRRIDSSSAETEGLTLRIWLELGRYDEALGFLNRAISKDPSDVDRYRVLVDLLERLDRLDQAIAPLEKGLQHVGEKREVDVLALLVYVCRKTKRYDEGLRFADRALDGDAGNLAIQLAKIEMYSEAGRSEEALRFAEQALEATPDSLPMQLTIMDLHKERKEFDKAVDFAQALLEKDPGNWRVQLALVDVYRAAGMEDRIEPLLVKVALDNKRTPEALYHIGLVKWEMEQLDEAESCLQAAVNLRPRFADPSGYAEACNSLGYLYAERGKRLDEALRFVEKALEVRPTAGHIIDSLGWVYYKKGEYDKAVQALEKAARIEREDSVVREHLGDAYFRAGRKDDALAEFKKALGLLSDEKKSEVLKRKIEQVEQGVDLPD
ncbi:MAG TPA: tetratricopeptide repeat protein [Sumerlaeia bacterium]|nr:tetratricopeptide repeat protein [Sumerlaeia bacterium]